ncbi:MAG: aminoacyl-tRNA hydrolase [Flavobacteriaceae bacterium]|nr:aminoacyl-tRNA hydrolase [Flavobacteriaceae bacterium]
MGNFGSEYLDTRHNIGFKVLDKVIEENEAKFEVDRLAFKSSFSHKGKLLICIKPTTYINLSGKAVRYWMKKEKIKLKNILIITDDLNLPYGKLRLKPKGSSGGHNGLKNIEECLNTSDYTRLRIGIDNGRKKNMVNFVLSKWTKEELKNLDRILNQSSDIILSFITDGLNETMNNFN